MKVSQQFPVFVFASFALPAQAGKRSRGMWQDSGLLRSARDQFFNMVIHVRKMEMPLWCKDSGLGIAEYLPTDWWCFIINLCIIVLISIVIIIITV